MDRPPIDIDDDGRLCMHGHPTTDVDRRRECRFLDAVRGLNATTIERWAWPRTGVADVKFRRLTWRGMVWWEIEQPAAIAAEARR